MPNITNIKDVKEQKMLGNEAKKITEKTKAIGTFIGIMHENGDISMGGYGLCEHDMRSVLNIGIRYSYLLDEEEHEHRIN